MTAMDEEASENVTSQDGGHGPTDVTDEPAVDDLFARTADRRGRVDVLFNNAGMGAPAVDIDAHELAVWNNVVAVNLTGTLLSMKHEIAHMRAHGGGVIVNIASNLGAHARRPGLGAYIATKAAVSALTRNAALDHIREGIRINSISPGPMDTGMSLLPGESPAGRADRMAAQLPIGRVGTLDEIAAAVLYLASPDAGFAVGTDLLFDGGAAE